MRASTNLSPTHLIGGASGDLATGVVMTDTSLLSLFFEAFAPGSHLRFRLGLTGAEDPGGIPYRFTFFILDSSGVPIPTLAPAGDFFLGVDLLSDAPIVEVFGSDPSRAPTVGNSLAIDAPVIRAVPEPATGALLTTAVLALALIKLKRADERNQA